MDRGGGSMTRLTEESVQLQPPQKPTRLKAMTGTECNRNYLQQMLYR